MRYDIIWMPNARISYAHILQYIAEKWSYAELEAFRNTAAEAIKRISTFPGIYEYSPESDTRRCVLTKQVSLYYQVKESQEVVELLVFWDNRQDPETLSLKDSVN